MNFREYLIEQALQRKTILFQMKNESKQVIIHLIKILKYKEEINKNKHISDIDGMLKNFVNLVNSKNSLKIENFIETFKVSNKEFSSYFRTVKRQYVIPHKETDENVKIKINEILDSLAKDLFNKEFTSIEKYL